MKSLPVFCTGLSLLLSCVCPAQAPADPKPAPATDDAASKDAKPDKPSAEEDAAAVSGLKAVDQLTVEQKKTLLQGIQEVSSYLRGVRLLESLQKLAEVETATGPNYYIENLRGAVFTKMRKFDRAREHFQSAVKFANGLPTESFHPRFNLAELDFVEKKWDAARGAFQKLLADPGKPGTGSDPLMNFKILICDLQQKKDAEAELVLKNFDQYDADTPAYYYANAVKLFARDDKDGANEWLESAKRIYPKELNEVFNDSLVEMGWLETLQ